MAQLAAALADAIEAASALGLDTTDARRVRQEVEDRLGLAEDVYVLALVGGTGVGKSSLLNALAGEVVSAASVRRPTTGRPVAWVAESASRRVQGLLGRLGVGDVRRHRRDDLQGVVILDLPDVDSLERAHRAAVEEVLPKVDAVAWVLDPEKYADAVLHDAFLATWVRRLARQVVVLNKVDRLPAGSLASVEAHLAGVLGDLRFGIETADATETREESRARGGPPPRHGATMRSAASASRIVPSPSLPILTTSTVVPDPGVGHLLGWLRAATDAKAVVASRLAAGAIAAIEDLAHAAGVDGDRPRLPLLDEGDRGRALRATTDDILRVIDLRGAERQAVAATRAQARPRGAGPLGRVTAFAYRASGREARVADPGRYLRGWRERGSLTRAAERVRSAVAATVPDAPRALRPRYAAATELRVVERTLGTAVERAIAAEPPLEAPTSSLWSIVGLLQTVATVALVLGAVWIVAWVILRPAVDSITVPIFGAVPAPLVLVVGAAIAGYLLARILSAHAGWVGRRWARRVASRIRDAVTLAVSNEAFGAVDAIEEARLRLWSALRELDRPGA